MTTKLITKNKKAFFDYEILESYEAGIDLLWHEVKSIRNGHVNLKWSYISLLSWRPYLKWMHVTPWKTLLLPKNDIAQRDRSLFLHKKTISFLHDKQKEWGFAIIPLELYFSGSLIKVRVGLCKWRKQYDKKQLLKERTLDKESKRMLKNFSY